MNRWFDGLSIILCACLALSSLPHPARAQSVAAFTVSTTQDAPHAIPVDGTCTAQLPGSPCTLRAAIQAANWLGAPAAIALPAGLYFLSIQGEADDAGASGDLDVTGQLTLTGAGSASTIIDGRVLNDRVLDVRPGATASINGVTVQNGRAPEFAGRPGDGGGIRNLGDLFLVDVVLDSNFGGRGGGLYNSAHSNAYLTRVQIRDNAADGCQWPGIAGGLSNDGGMNLTETTVDGNIANPTAGCGQATGGIANAGILSLYNSTLSRNAVLQSPGGSGAVYSTGVLSLINTTVSTNSSLGDDGQVGAITNRGEATVVHSTIAQNSGTVGTGLHSNGDVTIQDTILQGNQANGVTANCDHPYMAASYSLSSDATCVFAGSGSQNSLDSRLGSLQNNGGSVETHALLSGSPAIDAASLACGTPPMDIDARGVQRPEGPRCDVGAYEARPPTATATPTATITPTPTVTPTANASPGSTACTPRPNVAVVTSPIGTSALQVGISAQSNPGSNNLLQHLAFSVGRNASIDIGGLGTRTGPFTYTPAPGTISVTFTLRPTVAGQAVTLPLVVTDSCGDWPTFVGAGAAVFAPPTPAGAAATTAAEAPALPTVTPSATATPTLTRPGNPAPPRADGSSNGLPTRTIGKRSSGTSTWAGGASASGGGLHGVPLG